MVSSLQSTLFFSIIIYISGNNAYTKTTINSEEELNIVGNLIRQHSDCSGEAGLGGSTNEDANMQFAYSELYFQNTSLGELLSTITEYILILTMLQVFTSHAA